MHPDDGEMGGEVCLANIGGTPRRKRLASGLLGGLAALALVVALVATGAHRLWLLTAAPLIWMSAVGILQYRGRT